VSGTSWASAWEWGQAGMGSGIRMGLARTVERKGIFGQDPVLLVKLAALMALMQ
jgi:hypothetical protein